MGRIYQRYEGGPYHGYWTDGKGRQRRQTLRTRDAVVARARLRQLELASTDSAAHSHHRLGQAIKNLLVVVDQGNAPATWRSYRQKGENLIDALGDVELAELTRDAVTDYVQRRRKQGAADGTIHKELVVLRRALAEARTRGLWSGDPRAIVPSIKVRYEPREKWLTAKQAGRLLAALEPARRLWVAIALLAGLRHSEIEALRWEHVTLAQRRLRVPGRKTASAWRVVPLDPALVKLLRQASTRKQPSDPVVTPWPNVRRDLHVTIKRLNLAKPKDAIQLVSPNDLRRTFASWLKQRGLDSLVVAQLLGHTSTRMVERVYGRLDDKTFVAAIAALPRLRAV